MAYRYVTSDGRAVSFNSKKVFLLQKKLEKTYVIPKNNTTRNRRTKIENQLVEEARGSFDMSSVDLNAGIRDY